MHWVVENECKQWKVIQQGAASWLEKVGGEVAIFCQLQISDGKDYGHLKVSLLPQSPQNGGFAAKFGTFGWELYDGTFSDRLKFRGRWQFSPSPLPRHHCQRDSEADLASRCRKGYLARCNNFDIRTWLSQMENKPFKFMSKVHQILDSFKILSPTANKWSLEIPPHPKHVSLRYLVKCSRFYSHQWMKVLSVF